MINRKNRFCELLRLPRNDFVQEACTKRTPRMYLGCPARVQRSAKTDGKMGWLKVSDQLNHRLLVVVAGKVGTRHSFLEGSPNFAPGVEASLVGDERFLLHIDEPEL